MLHTPIFELLDLTPEQWLRAPRAGANAARGFHFQDAMLAWTVITGVTGEAQVGLVIPEGRDDATLRLGPEAADMQVKSRQPGQRSVGAGEAASWIRDLAARRGDGPPADRLILAIERGLTQTGLGATAEKVDEVRAFLEAPLAARLGPQDAAAVLRRLHIVVVPDPVSDAAAALVKVRGLHPATARLAAQQIMLAIAACQDLNAEAPAHPAALTLTDAAALVDRAVEQVDLAALDEALRSGLCEAVDFGHADEDPGYLHGVATTAAHVAAGVVIDRPAAVAEATEVLSRRRRALIVGPSGVGKSAVGWLTVFQTRHRVRWYRVKQLDAAGVVTLDRLARGLDPSPENPIGFVLDDVARIGPAAWDQLIAEFAARSGVLLLGTIREQDLPRLGSLAEVGVLRPVLDEALAAELWTRLREGGRTNWGGWREPFALARGLTLEYAAILTRGERIGEVLEAQISGLAAEGAEDELAVLAAVAVADQLGGRIAIEGIASVAALERARVVAAARRLHAEFLVRVEGSIVAGLHELRSLVAAETVHRLVFREMRETVEAVLRVMPLGSSTTVIARAIDLSSEDEVLAALVAREADPDELVTILESLREAELRDAAEAAAKLLEANVQPGQILNIAASRFGASIHDSVELFINAPELIPAPSNRLREAFIERAGTRSVQTRDAATLARLRTAWSGAEDPRWWRDALAEGIVARKLADVVALLDAARAASRETHAAAVAAIGGERFTAAVAAGQLGFDVVIDGVHTSEPTCRWSGDHKVDVTTTVLAALPSAERLVLRSIDDFGVAQPPMRSSPPPLERVCADPAASRAVQQRHRAAVLVAVGLPHWTGRLETEQRLLPGLARAIETSISDLARRSRDPGAAFAGGARAAMNLPAPPSARLLADVPQRVSADHEPDPFVTLLADPRRVLSDTSNASLAAAAAFRFWRVAADLQKQGRWSLLPDHDEAVVTRIVELFAVLRDMLAERNAVGDREWTNMTGGAALSGLRALHERACRQAEERLKRRSRRMAEALEKAGVSATVTVEPAEWLWAASWPPGTLVVTADVGSAHHHPRLVAEVLRARQAAFDEQRRVMLLVRIRGALSGSLCGEVGLRWSPDLDAIAALGRQGRDEPRSEAWRHAVNAATKERRAGDLAREFGSTDSPITGVLETSFAAAAEDGQTACRALEALGLRDAAALQRAIATGGQPLESLRDPAQVMALSLAEADADG